MTSEEQLRRANRAQQIIDDPLYREAWDSIRDKIVAELESADLDDAMRKRLNDLLIAHKRAKFYLESVMQVGQHALREIERKENMAERAKKALGRFR